MSHRRSRTALALASVLLVSLLSSAAAAPQERGSPLAGLAGAPTAPGSVGERDLIEVIEEVFGSSTITTGTDGRLTVLLMGSDFRPDYDPGERTDVIMVVSLNPAAKTIAAASIPRDTVYFPRHPKRGGSSGSGRVNEMYHAYGTQPGYDFEPAAAAKFKEDVAHTLGVEIDYYAYIRFGGVDALVDEVNGLKVKIRQQVLDPIYADESSPPPGIYFPRDTSGRYELRGVERVDKCPSTAVTCHRAIVFARSRKGANNGDPERTVRQQELVNSAIRKVSTFDPTALAGLVAASNAGLDLGVQTNMPRTLNDALHLRDLLSGATMSLSNRVTFTDTAYTTDCCALPRYTHKLKLKPVRAWVDTHMAAVP